MKLNIRKHVPLAPLSTFHIGGHAECFCSVQKPEDLIEAILYARQEHLPYKILAGGSNVVFPDTKLKGLLIQILGGKLSIEENDCVVDAGVALSDVIKQSIKRGLKGLETLSGIPGTVGGAIVGNAGAYGHSISEVVEKVEIWDGEKRRWLRRSQCRFRYRESVFKEKPYLMLRAVLRLTRGDPKALQKTSREIIRIRLKKYKPALRCPGSFFKNVLVQDVPKRSLQLVDRTKIIQGKIPTGYLLEQVGAKGMRAGGIKIASFHGNLFINQGRGTARDVRRLARILKGRVKRKFGILLEEEIRYF
jgi:UDP-N-acetylmuramate dehydrogenase